MSTFSRLVASAPPRLLAWLQTPVAGPLGDSVDRGTVRVRPVVERAERRLEMLAAKIKYFADMWREDAQAGGQVIDWSEVTDQDVKTTMLPDILEQYGSVLLRNYGADEHAVLGGLVAYRDAQRAAELTGISIWTDAPQNYDHGYTRRTRDTYAPGIMQGKVMTRVVVPTAEQARWQGERYGSGGHLAFDEERMEKERAYDAKRSALEPYNEIARDLGKVVDVAAKQLRVHYDGQAGYWKAGVYKSVYNESTRSAYPYPVSESELPPADPVGAAHALAEARRRFRALPKVARDEHWHVGANIDDLLKQAGRQVRERVELGRQRAKAAEKEKNRLAAARDLMIERLEGRGVPGDRNLVLVRMRMKSDGFRADWLPECAFGRVTAWPPSATHVETECGPVEISYDKAGTFASGGMAEGATRLDARPGPAESVPVAVWAVGAFPPLAVATSKGEKVYAYKPTAYGADPVVLRADGRKIPKNSVAYGAGVAALEGKVSGETQDELVDGALRAYLAEYEPAPRWGPARSVKGMLVQFHPPAQPGKKGSLVGWKVRARVDRGGKLYWLTLTREAKRHPESKSYWQTEGDRGLTADTETTEWVLNLDKADRDKARAYLLADPSRGIKEAQKHLQGRA